MRKVDAEQEIIREWEAFHRSRRQTERYAAMFTMAIKDKYPFSYDGDRDQAVKAIIAKHRNIKADRLTSCHHFHFVKSKNVLLSVA